MEDEQIENFFDETIYKIEYFEDTISMANKNGVASNKELADCFITIESLICYYLKYIVDLCSYGNVKGNESVKKLELIIRNFLENHFLLTQKYEIPEYCEVGKQIKIDRIINDKNSTKLLVEYIVDLLRTLNDTLDFKNKNLERLMDEADEYMYEGKVRVYNFGS